MKKQRYKEFMSLINTCKGECDKAKGNVRKVLPQIAEYLRQLQDMAKGESAETDELIATCFSLIGDIEQKKGKPSALGKTLERLKNKAKNEIKVGKEVLFLPYKVAMSDSLKTIYLAAKADPDCEAYWCPIPYYDKNPDDSLGKMYYECDYDDDFTVTDWQKYDIAKKHPDIIFFNYGYDGVNIITAVHPNFYSEQLKKYTDLLVYVDYGLTMYTWRNLPEKLLDQQAYVPGYWNSDLVVTYSADQAKLLKLHMYTVKSYGTVSMGYNPEKFVPLGSPKFDIILRDKKENYPLPEEWKRIIGDKKILLYNASIRQIISNPVAFVEETKKLTDIFEKEQQCVLWWRPHPLTQNTINTMQPGLRKLYDLLVSQFKGKGIYDETDNLHRAIAWSDGCLSTESSLVWLYMASGKPFTLIDTKKKLPSPQQIDDGNDFSAPLKYRISNMRLGAGMSPDPNKPRQNQTVWWSNFLPEDVLHKIHYNNFYERFIHYLTHQDLYPEAEEYRKLQLQIFREVVVNSDGTAGQKIYEFCRQKSRK